MEEKLPVLLNEGEMTGGTLGCKGGDRDESASGSSPTLSYPSYSARTLISLHKCII